MDTIVVVLKVIITMNFVLSLLYSVKNYRLTKSDTWLFLCMSVGTAFVLSFIRLVKEFFYPSLDEFTSIVVVMELVKINLIPFVTAFLLSAAITISRGRMSTVIPMGPPDEAQLQYGIKRGTTYLVREETPQQGFSIFLDLVSHRYRGLAILRTHPDEVRREYDIKDVPILWMSRLQVGENVVYPNIKVIEQIIEEFLETAGKNVILLERLDYLITQQGFEKTLQFIQKLSSMVYVTKSVALVHIDPLTIGERELMLIEKETKVFQKSAELEEELAELLMYVYNRNVGGEKPNLKQVTRDLSLSRNTARKRINTLRTKGLLILKEKGRQKVLEITRKGEDLIR
jgi:hypothetical protein